MTAPPLESALLVAARQLAEEARERRWAAPVRRRRPGVPGNRYGSVVHPG